MCVERTGRKRKMLVLNVQDVFVVSYNALLRIEFRSIKHY